jgi:hypothetical protein
VERLVAGDGGNIFVENIGTLASGMKALAGDASGSEKHRGISA